MNAPAPQVSALPTPVRVVAMVLMAAGGLYAIIGMTGISSLDRTEALAAMGSLVLGVAAVATGWRVLQGDRWAHVAAVALLSIAVVTVVVSAIRASDRAILAQAFLPGVGIWLLVRAESRTHFHSRSPE